MWPAKIEKVLEYYYGIQESNVPKVLTIDQRKDFVEKMISEYETLSYEERKDILVPAQWEFLAERAIKAEIVGTKKYRYDVCYNWPPNCGYEGVPQKVKLMSGCEYDRIGSDRGRFMSPISTDDGAICSFLERALPYYIPEEDISKSPAYHRYKVLLQYPGSSLSADEVFCGEIAHAFWCNPDDGGGTQVELPSPIGRLGVVFHEIR